MNLRRQMWDHVGVRWFALAVVMVAATTSMIGFMAGAPAGPVSRDDAIAACQGYVMKRAHNPRSVEWINSSSWPASRASEHSPEWTVIATYRATNGFGALRLVASTCVMRGEARDDWRLIELFSS